ncbi:serine/threonine protein kinase [Apiospora arundinis]|uniref:Serine/threonine protein kinase n=1 Tax=Apiospora arundinis TaxID=335852 RepID=A0ABR2I9B0_9PEZI
MHSDAPEAVRFGFLHPEEEYPQAFSSSGVHQPQCQHQQHHDGTVTDKNWGITTTTIADVSSMNEKSSTASKVCAYKAAVMISIKVATYYFTPWKGFHNASIQNLTLARSSSESNSSRETKSTTTAMPPSSSSSISPSASSPFTTVPTSDVRLALDCPKLNGDKKKILVHDEVSTYTYQCDVDFPGVLYDIMGITTYTVEDCLRACSRYNQQQGKKVCVGITFFAAVAQVFSFIIQALRVEPPPMSWHDAAAQLDTWAVEYEDVLSKIPVSDRKGPRSRDHTYKARPWPGFYRSPIKTRSGCKPTSQEGGRRRDDDDNRDPPSPSPNRPAQPSHKPPGTLAARSREKQGWQCREKARHDEPVQTSIKNRPYCTHQCLLGLAFAGPIDKNCPNANDHGERHIARSKFLSLLRSQLARDRGPDADCVPLYISGSLGSLFKVRLSSYGYTLVAKGMESADRLRLCHEKKMYDQIRDIQGKFTPVCLGLLDLALPQYCDGGVYKHLMLLSWGGRPLLGCVDQVDKQSAIAGVASAFATLHRLGVLHRDAEARNILFDAPTGRVMVVDFERAEFRGREPLSCLTAQSQNRKRKRKASKKQVTDDFGREYQSVMGSLSKILESAA